MTKSKTPVVPPVETQAEVAVASVAATPARKTRKPKAVAAPAAVTKAAKPQKAAKTVKPKAAPVAPVAEKPAKAKPPKLVRDGFTIPKDEYDALAALKQRATKLGNATRKSELLRAGIKALLALDDAALLAALALVPVIKTGRPGKD